MAIDPVCKMQVDETDAEFIHGNLLFLCIVVRPAYGLAQRALFAAWFGWCTGVGVFLLKMDIEEPPVVFALKW
jgi:hypothetical protein